MLVQMILEGKSLSLAADNQTKNIVLQLSQLITLSALKRQRDQKVVMCVIDLPNYCPSCLHWFALGPTLMEKGYYQ